MTGLRVSRHTFVGSVIAGLVMALVSIPGGIANGLLAGVNPIYGVYSMIAGTTVASFFTSSVIMNVDSTGATALATFDALGDVAPEDQLGHLVVLSCGARIFGRGVDLRFRVCQCSSPVCWVLACGGRKFGRDVLTSGNGLCQAAARSSQSDLVG